MISQDLFLKLYPNVVPVRGYNRSTFTDLFTQKYHLVPNGAIDIFEIFDFEKKSFYTILNEIDDEETKLVLKEYLDFILSNDLGVLTDHVTANCITSMPLDFYPDSKIKNAIIELDNTSTWNIKNILEQLNLLGTQFLEIRFLDYQSFVNNIISIKDLLAVSTIESVYIFVPNNANLKEFIDENLYDFYRIKFIIVYNTKIQFELKEKSTQIVFSSQESVDKNHCGNVSIEYFSTSTPSYINNRNNNNCLAYKISVDKNGIIRNCPSMIDGFGHADNIALAEILLNGEFKKHWKTTKDKISICSDCEFRWVCSDCRAFTQSPENNFAKPSKCSYNPYISLWAGHENYLTEEECGITLTEGKVVIDHEKLEQINQKIWG